MHGRLFEELGVGVPIQELEVWDPEAAKLSDIKFSEFALPYEDARTIGQEHGKRLDSLKSLPEDAVVLRKVYRVMVPTYYFTAFSTEGTEMGITTLYITHPIILDWYKGPE